MRNINPKELGELRQAIHKNNTTERFFDDPNEENRIGIVGEIVFGDRYDLPIDINLYEWGDKNIDFTTPAGTIDVKTARIPKYLLVKEKKITKCADILVLAKYISDDNVKFLGWERKEVMMKMPIKDFGYGIRNYFRAASDLKPMEELDQLLNCEHKDMHDTEDKSWWCIHGSNLEKKFIPIMNRYHIPAGINPQKEKDPYAPDLIIKGKLADLKTQNAPFFTASQYGFDPRYTVTFNRKDYERYKKHYPNLNIYFWVDWQTIQWNNLTVKYLNDIFAISFSKLSKLIENAPEHFYQKRINDEKKNAKSSFLLDVREMQSLRYYLKQKEMIK